MATNSPDPPEDVPQGVYDFLKIHNELEFISENKKIKCTLTGHEMPCKLNVLQTHTQGKKYKKLKKQSDFDYEKYKPHIVPSNKKGHVNQLFCLLTLRHINKEPAHVEKHANGRRYKKALARYEECQRTGETFRPKKHNKKRQTSDDESDPGRRGEQGKHKESRDRSDSEGSGADTFSDSLSDLYPADYFENGDDEEAKNDGEQEGDSDFDPNDVDVDAENKPTAAATDSDKKRRKKQQQNSSSVRPKKFKRETQLDTSDPKPKTFKGKKKKKKKNKQ
ncbi:surfeit locus protein 2-like [Ptychodera flava]|uniref:surfeit locus protein 2-like n=1 Tax=Ptychodera flava TaxID=63121 RepID=UPI00396A7881